MKMSVNLFYIIYIIDCRDQFYRSYFFVVMKIFSLIDLKLARQRKDLHSYEEITSIGLTLGVKAVKY